MNIIIDQFEKIAKTIIEKSEIFKFNTNQLPDINNFTTDILADNSFRGMFILLNKKPSHCLYWFSLQSKETAKKLNDLLNDCRESLSRPLRAVPPKNKNTWSNVLYVGIRKGGVRKRDKLTNISGRIVHHLGYYKGATRGLQFVHWAKDKNFEIELHIIEFKDLPDEYLNVIESIVSYSLKPLCGKH